MESNGFEDVDDLIEHINSIKSKTFAITDTEISENKLSLSAWGSEPFWSLSLDSNLLIFNDSVYYNLTEEISTVGFSLEFPRTFIFDGKEEKELILTVDKREDGCFYDNSDSQTDWYVHLLFTDETSSFMYLGCAEIENYK